MYTQEFQTVISNKKKPGDFNNDLIINRAAPSENYMRTAKI